MSGTPLTVLCPSRGTYLKALSYSRIKYPSIHYSLYHCIQVSKYHCIISTTTDPAPRIRRADSTTAAQPQTRQAPRNGRPARAIADHRQPSPNPSPAPAPSSRSRFWPWVGLASLPCLSPGARRISLVRSPLRGGAGHSLAEGLSLCHSRPLGHTHTTVQPQLNSTQLASALNSTWFRPLLAPIEDMATGGCSAKLHRHRHRHR